MPDVNPEQRGLWKKVTESHFWVSTFRQGLPTSDLDRMRVMVSNFILHILPAKVHPHSLKPTYTFGLGVIATVMLILLVITGALLMFFYVPSTERAYRDMKDLEFMVSYGILLRNMHRWAAHGMVVAAFLHMARVFYTASYRSPREFNWVVGVVLWLMTLGLSFTGYLLPWDQLAFWAITVGTSIASYPPLVGETIRTMMLGGHTVGQAALIRFYTLHVVVLPVFISLLLAIHIWRVRKDGGLSRPRTTPGQSAAVLGIDDALPKGAKTWALVEVTQATSPMVETQAPEEEIPSWPHLTFRLLLLFQLTLIGVMFISILFNAPLEELANEIHPPNPAKAPWYFLGLQELVSFSAFVGGVVVPSVAVLGLMSVPYFDTRNEGACSCHWRDDACENRTMTGIWFTSGLGRRVSLISFLAPIPTVLVLTYLNVQAGLRVWYPGAPQWLADVVNPATVLLLLVALSSVLVAALSRSRRLGAISLFSSFLGAFIVLTIVAVYFRGPNWGWTWPW